MLAAFLKGIRDHDLIAPRQMADRLQMPTSRLAKLAHVNHDTMTSKPDSPTIQAKLGEIAQVIAQAADLAGDEGRAIIWFKHQPIPGFGKTPEQLIELDQTNLVLEDLERTAAGVYS